MSNDSGSAQHSPVSPPSSDAPSAGASSQALRREALLPTERNRGLGSVAVVCTMAGVASGLALATTLMAMQVADTMGGAHHHCPHRAAQMRTVTADAANHGYLGIEYAFANGSITLSGTRPGSPARAAGLMTGDHVIAVNGDRVDSETEMHSVIYSQRPGARPVILVQRDGLMWTVHPTLAPASTIR